MSGKSGKSARKTDRTNSQYQRVTPERRETYLAALREGHTKRAAARRAGPHTSAFDHHVRNDPEFAEQVKEALEEGCLALEDIMLRGAAVGAEERVYDGEGNLIRRSVREKPELARDLLSRRKPIEPAGPVTAVLVLKSAFEAVRPRPADITIEPGDIKELMPGGDEPAAA